MIPKFIGVEIPSHMLTRRVVYFDSQRQLYAWANNASDSVIRYICSAEKLTLLKFLWEKRKITHSITDKRRTRSC